MPGTFGTLGVGRAHKGTKVTMLVADLDERIIAEDTGELIEHLTIDARGL